MTCPSGYEMTKDYRCEKIYCEPGYKLEGNNCVARCTGGYIWMKYKCVNTCNKYQKWNESGENCDWVKCHPGYELKNGTCVAVSCPGGYELDPKYKCKKIKCPYGQRKVGNRCIKFSCPSGTEIEGELCVSVCSYGENWWKGKCKKACEAGTEKWNKSTGKCDRVGCKPGYNLVKGECIKFKCEPGYTMVGTKCVKMSCPQGFTYRKGRCFRAVKPIKTYTDRSSNTTSRNGNGRRLSDPWFR